MLTRTWVSRTKTWVSKTKTRTRGSRTVWIRTLAKVLFKDQDLDLMTKDKIKDLIENVEM